MLTPRQLQIAGGLSRGLTYDQIGRELGISPRTVEVHVRAAAQRIQPECNRPRDTVLLWFVRLDEAA